MWPYSWIPVLVAAAWVAVHFLPSYVRWKLAQARLSGRWFIFTDRTAEWPIVGTATLSRSAAAVEAEIDFARDRDGAPISMHATYLGTSTRQEVLLTRVSACDDASPDRFMLKFDLDSRTLSGFAIYQDASTNRTATRDVFLRMRVDL